MCAHGRRHVAFLLLLLLHCMAAWLTFGIAKKQPPQWQQPSSVLQSEQSRNEPRPHKDRHILIMHEPQSGATTPTTHAVSRYDATQPNNGAISPPAPHPVLFTYLCVASRFLGRRFASAKGWILAQHTQVHRHHHSSHYHRHQHLHLATLRHRTRCLTTLATRRGRGHRGERHRHMRCMTRMGGEIPGRCVHRLQGASGKRLDSHGSLTLATMGTAMALHHPPVCTVATGGETVAGESLQGTAARMGGESRLPTGGRHMVHMGHTVVVVVVGAHGGRRGEARNGMVAQSRGRHRGSTTHTTTQACSSPSSSHPLHPATMAATCGAQGSANVTAAPAMVPARTDQTPTAIQRHEATAAVAGVATASRRNQLLAQTFAI